MQINDQQDLEKPDIHSSSAEYRQRFSGSVGEWFLQTQNRISQDYLKNYTTPTTVVDFGGGHGQNIDVCQQLSLDLTILGSDASCFSEIKQNHFDALPKMQIDSLLNSQLSDQQFDLALSYRVLPHIADWQAHIKELCRVSKQSVIIEFPNQKSVNAFAENLFGLKKKIEGNTRHFKLFKAQQVVVEFEQHGFVLANSKGQYLLPMALHRALKNRSICKFLESLAGLLLPRHKLGSPLICKFDRNG